MGKHFYASLKLVGFSVTFLLKFSHAVVFSHFIFNSKCSNWFNFHSFRFLMLEIYNLRFHYQSAQRVERCNCWIKESRPLNGEYLSLQLVHRATVTNAVKEDMKKYFGLADNTFKGRYNHHKRDFKHPKYRNCT